MRFAILILLCAQSAFSASRYIRAGAAGANNGTSWTDAWTTFGGAGTETRGDTYYVAGGTYTETVIIGAALSGTAYITIKKANATDNSGDAGWSSAYESAQVKIVGTVDLNFGYIRFDGVTGSETNGHGILITNTALTTCLTLEAGGSGYQVIGTEIRGTNMTTQTSFDGINWNNTGATQKGLLVERCWIHEVSRNGVTLGGIVGTSFSDYGALFRSNVVMRTGDVQNGDHGQSFQVCYATEGRFLRWEQNKIYNVLGSAMIAMLAGAGSIHHDYRIVNNVFFNTDNVTFNVISPGVVWSHADAIACSNVFIANNTFYNIGSAANPGSQAQVVLETVGATNNSLVNNLWESCNLTAKNFGFATNRNNGFYLNTGTGATASTGSTNGQVIGVSSALTSPSAGDYSLVASSYAVDSGFDISDTVTADYAGAAWSVPFDLGAYEFQSGASPTTYRGFQFGSGVKLIGPGRIGQ